MSVLERRLLRGSILQLELILFFCRCLVSESAIDMNFNTVPKEIDPAKYEQAITVNPSAPKNTSGTVHSSFCN